MTIAPKTDRTARTVKALRIGALLLGTSAIGLTASYAATKTWNPIASTDWFGNGNWSPTGVPGVGDTAIVTGAIGSLIGGAATNNLAEVDIGATGIVHVNAAGVLNVTNGVGTIYVGKDTGNTSQFTVDGANSTVNANTLNVGFNGTGTADFEAGSIGAIGTTIVGQNAGSVGHLLINNSTVNTGVTYIGNNGTANIAIGAGAVVTSQSVIIAAQSGTSNALVDGPNTKWDISTGTLNIGNGGTGSAIIQGGATLLTKGLDLGVTATGIGELDVNDATTVWTDTGATRIGVAGQGTLKIQNGAVATTGATSVGVSAGSNGTLLVDGTNSHLTTQALQLGVVGAGALSVSGGGLLTTADALVGGGGFGSAMVSGANSDWDLGTHGLTVGSAGTAANSLSVSTGGHVEAGAVTIGDGAGSRGTIALTDSVNFDTLRASGQILVGNNGQGAIHVSSFRQCDGALRCQDATIGDLHGCGADDTHPRIATGRNP